MTLTIGSLFAGVGGLELGLEWAGLGPVRWQVEIDPWCRGVLAMHWPHAKRFADVRQVSAAELDHVDVICGGFPCQDVSVAGKGAGIEGARSGLWKEYARIVREVRPRVVVVENVAQLVTRGLDVVVADLVAAGYDVHGRLLSAADVGAPHLRERLFLMAYAGRSRLEGTHEREQEDAESTGRDPDLADADRRREPEPSELQQQVRRRTTDGSEQRGRDVADADGERVRQQQQRMSRRRPRRVRDEGESLSLDDGEEGGRDAKSRMGRSLDGIPDRVDRWPARPGDAPAIWEPSRARRVTTPTSGRRLHALGNAVVPQCAEVVGRAVIEALEAGLIL